MNTINLNTPTSWIELNNKQLKFVSKLFMSEFASIQSRFLTHALIFFTKIKIKQVNSLSYRLKVPKHLSFQISTSLLLSITNLLQWLLDEVTEIKPLRSIAFAKPVHYRLHNTNFEVFLAAENYYIAFEQTKDTVHLNNLIACLYYLPLQKFNEKKIVKRGKYFSFVPIHVKYTVFLWYSGFRYLVSNKCPDLFHSNKKSSNQAKLIIKDHILGLIRGLTEGDVTKTNNIYKTDTWTALYELDAKAKEGREFRENYPQKI